ncbi:hypothetical protein HRbin10_02099 [bacterium HR10]|nr:hypothetical protein HRbin10_02099 [bacterium HR10]
MIYDDSSNLPGMTRLMNKKHREKLMAFLLPDNAIALWIAENLRDRLYGEPIQEAERVPQEDRLPGAHQPTMGKT